MSTTWDSAPERPETAPGDGPAGWVAPNGAGPAPHVPAPREPEEAGFWAPRASPPGTGERLWPAWSAPIALLSALIVATVGGLIVAVVGVALTGSDLEDSPPGVLLGGTLVQDIGFAAAAILFARMTGPVWAAQFGLRGTSFWRSAGWVLVLYVAFAAFTAIWSAVVPVEEDDLLDQFGTKDSDLLLVLTGVTVCVLAPLVEELLFRGYMFTALRNWKGVWIGAALVGLIFGGLHLASSPIGAIVPLMVFGFGLCLLYAKTGSLYPCIAVHAINNAIAFSVMNDWTWQVPLVIAGSLALCFAVALPLARRFPAPARA